MGGKITKEEKPAIDALNNRILEKVDDQANVTVAEVIDYFRLFCRRNEKMFSEIFENF